MKKQLTIFLMLLNTTGFAQKKNIFELQLAGVKSIPQTNFSNNINNYVNSGKITSCISILLSHRIQESNFSLETGIRFYYKNFKFRQNIDTLTYFGEIYSQPKYRIISVPLLVSLNKEIDINFNPISKKKRIIVISSGLSLDFIKEFSIRNGMMLTGKGFGIKTTFKNNFSFKSNTGVSFNGLVSYPIFKFLNEKYLYLIGGYKYPFYRQNNIYLNYNINGDIKEFNINKAKLQEITFGLSLRWY